MCESGLIKRILVLTANPQNTDQLRLDEEVRDIENALLQSQYRDRFMIKSEWAVQQRDIRRAILRVKPHIVHFSGHGAESGGLMVEDVLHQAQQITPSALAQLFELVSEHVECVLLNACYSEAQAEAIAQHIDVVIGMNRAIGDRAAIEFSVGFYDALGSGYSAKDAYKFGCNAIELANLQEYLVPVLKQKHNTSPFSSEANAKDCKETSKVTYEFVLTGNIDEVSKQKLEAIVIHLQQITGDVSLTLLRIDSGSIKLIIEGSENSFQVLKSLIESGELDQVLGIAVEGIERQKPNEKLIECNVLQWIHDESVPEAVRQSTGWNLSEIEVQLGTTKSNSFKDWVVDRNRLSAFLGKRRGHKIIVLEKTLKIQEATYKFRISTIDEKMWRFSLEPALPGVKISPEIQLTIIDANSATHSRTGSDLPEGQEELILDIPVEAGDQLIWQIVPKPENHFHEILQF